MKAIFPSLALCTSLILPVGAQVLTPPTDTPSKPAPSTPSNNTSGSDTTTINRSSSDPKSPHGEEIPIIDPTNKTVTFQGRSYSLMDNNLGGQFEAYLASDEFGTEASKNYRATIQAILSHLNPTNPEGSDLKAAYSLLETASGYPGDGNICDSLANSIYAALLVKQGTGNSKEAIAKLNSEKQRLINNISVMESKQTFQQPSGGGQGNQAPPRPISTELLVMKQRLVEIEAIKRKYETQGAIGLTQSKVQYQAMMVQLFMQRRFEHVVIASRFYNLIYKDGDQKMHLKKDSEVEKFFSEGIGVNPTVAGLDAAANEAIRKVKSLINAFENNLANDRLHAASERLVEAYAIGEFLPIVQTVPISSKSKIQQYVQDGNDLVEALSSKELILATELNDTLKQQARDYNSSKATAYISAHKRASDSFVRDAKFAMFEKDTERAKLAIENAIKMWPNNPAIEDFNQSLDKRFDQTVEESDMASNSVKEFDRLIADGNYRAIVEEPRKSKFIVVLGQLNDDDRLDKLKEIGQSISEIERALEKSKSLQQAGQPHAAWEAIYEAQIKYFDDAKIANEKAQLSGAVATFTNALETAKKLETDELNPQSGSALSWYLMAREIYPQSRFAKEGIQRIIDKEFNHSN